MERGGAALLFCCLHFSVALDKTISLLSGVLLDGVQHMWVVLARNSIGGRNSWSLKEGLQVQCGRVG